MKQIRKNIVFILIAMVLANVLVWAPAFAEDKNLLVAFLDVGQGDAIYIRTPTGTDMLIDGGRDSGKLISALSGVMKTGDRAIDVVVATHPDADHIGGLARILESYKVSTLLISGNMSETSAYDAVLQNTSEFGVQTILARAGEKISLGDGVDFEILWPAGDVRFIESNSASVVGIVSFGQTRFLLTGDAPSEVEHKLSLAFPEELSSAILKLGHHGSRTSSSEEFLRAVAPELAIISAGKGNSYGHPHLDVLARLETLGIPHISTIEKGTITCESDSVKIECY